MTSGDEGLIGARLGNFEIISEIGRGGMGVVYRARQVSLNRDVALKVLPSSVIQDDTAGERFTREAHAMAQLSHPSIVDVIEVGEQDGVRYFAMQLVDGPSLAEMTQQHGGIEAERAAEIAAEVADALDHAHERGVVHRDIKPGNILIAEDGRAVVTDFGIAKAIEGALAGGQSLTQGTIGTPEYMSPEIIRGNPVDGRTDIYSLGIVLYQMLTGRVPFSATTPFEMANRHLSDPPTPPSALGTPCPQWLESVLLKALAKEPAQRFSSAAEMASALRAGSTVPLPGGSQSSSQPPDMSAPSPAPAVPQLDLSNLNEPRTYYGITLPRYIWALAATGAALLAIAILWLIGRSLLIAFMVTSTPPPEPPPLKVTDVTGLTFKEARQSLAEDGLTEVQADTRHDATVRKGHVLAQAPEAGATVHRGAHVDLTVSLGPRPQQTVPDTTGLSRTDAEAMLADAGFSVRVSGQEYSSQYDSGQVITQEPPAGSTRQPEAEVSLIISRGPQPSLPQLETFTNAKRGYRIKKPVGWSIEHSSYGQGEKYYDTNFLFPHDDVKVMAETGPAGSSSDPLDSWRALDRQFRQKYGADYSCLELKHTTLGGHRAGYWEFVLTRNGKCYRKIDVGTNVGKRGFAVLCQAPPDRFEDYRELFETMIESFELL